MDDGRVEDLEIRIAFLEKGLSDLDEVVRVMADQLDELRRLLREVREDLGGNRIQLSRDPGDDVPPHY